MLFENLVSRLWKKGLASRQDAQNSKIQEKVLKSVRNYVEKLSTLKMPEKSKKRVIH